MLKLVEEGVYNTEMARACRTLARIRNIQHRTTACMNDFIFAQRNIPSEKRLNSLMRILREFPTAKAHKVQDRGFVRGLESDITGN